VTPPPAGRVGAGARAAVDQALQDPGAVVGQRHDRAGGERRVHPPGEEAQPAVPAGLLPAGARQPQHRGLPHRPEELRPELCRIQPHLLPAAGQGQVGTFSLFRVHLINLLCSNFLQSNARMLEKHLYSYLYVLYVGPSTNVLFLDKSICQMPSM